MNRYIIKYKHNIFFIETMEEAYKQYVETIKETSGEETIGLYEMGKLIIFHKPKIPIVIKERICAVCGIDILEVLFSNINCCSDKCKKEYNND